MGLKNIASRLVTRYIDERQLPEEAKLQLQVDRVDLPEHDAGPAVVAAAGIEWLKRSQDMSISRDGGSARDYSLLKGWSSSYPETSGYIVPTLIDYADRTNDLALANRARRMLDWLVSIQFPEGGFQGGKVDASPHVPVTFNTGQILIGLAAGVRRFGDVYRAPMNLAAAWLRDTQDADGCWRKHATPFAAPGDKAYETHVSWGLFEAARLEPTQEFGEAGLKQVHWALTKQADNGWFASNCLSSPNAPLTHTIGYVLRGVIEAYRFSGEMEFLAAARRTADALLEVIERDGRIGGQLDKNWKATVEWVCLTGNVQIAACWFLLHSITGKKEYLEAARRANRYVRRTVHLTDNPDAVGGVRGAFPVDGDYGKFEYLNWATKFCIDSQLMEMMVTE
ncbi:prenyltransferase/squalene oxidase repeat-containing protein [Polaromonas sp. UC242_47]|uniref:prenyltransferase/squalene oxidase repeat-containing protein n=1 Tax=Polaromonas sp. UC242_47 TaxID=3374626 RepID=UPI00379BD0A7